MAGTLRGLTPINLQGLSEGDRKRLNAAFEMIRDFLDGGIEMSSLSPSAVGDRMDSLARGDHTHGGTTAVRFLSVVKWDNA